MSKNKKKKRTIKKNEPSQPLQNKKEFICLRCGYCCICSTPAFTREEYKVVKNLRITRERNVTFKKVNFDTLVNRFNPKKVFREYAYFTENGIKTLGIGRGIVPPPCEFLDKDEDGKYLCAIYPYRPSVCKDFGVKEWQCPNNPNYLKKVTE